MAVGVTHSTNVVVADDGVSPVGTNEWNAAHTVTGVPTTTTDNAAIRADGTGGNMQNSKFIIDDNGGAIAGDGTATNTLAVNGSTSGTGGGAGFQLRLGGGNALWMGNNSWVFGTAYDPTPAIYAPLILMQGTVNVGDLRVNNLPVYPTAWTTNTSDVTLANVTTAQNLFASAQDTFNVLANTTYRVHATIFIHRSAGTTAHNTLFVLGGTYGDGGMRLLLRATNPAGNLFAIPLDIEMTAKTGQFIAGSNSVADEQIRLEINGILRTTTAGTLIPQMQYDAAPGGAPTVKANSYFSLSPIGADTLAQAGGWA